MAYLLLAICVFYALFWGVGFLFALRSKGSKQPLIPLLGLVGFVLLGVYSGQRSMDTMNNPHLLTEDSYGQLKKDMTFSELEDIFGDAQPDSRDDYDLGAAGIRIHPALSDLLGSQRHKDRTKAMLAIRVEGRAGPMGDNLARVRKLHQSREAEWDRRTRDWEKRMGRLFASQAKDARADASGYADKVEGMTAELEKLRKEPESDERDKKIDELEDGIAVSKDVGEVLDLLAKGYQAHADDPSYESMHVSMLLSDKEGVIIRTGPWSGLGCQQTCPDGWEQPANGPRTCPSDPEWDCPVRDLQKSLVESGKFSTITGSGSVKHPAYRQSSNRTTVEMVDAVEGGFGGQYKPTRKVHSNLAKKIGMDVALPPEPPDLGLAGWATEACHRKDVEDKLVYESSEPELPTLQSVSADEEDEKGTAAEVSATNGVLGLQLALVEPGESGAGSQTLLIEGHVCEDGYDRMAETPEWFAEQPGADSVWVDDEILGFRECKAIRGANQAKTCCSALKGSWNNSEESCTSRKFKYEQLPSFEAMMKSNVGDVCSDSLSGMVKKIEDHGRDGVQDALSGMVNGALYECEMSCPEDDDEGFGCSWDCDGNDDSVSLTELGGDLLEVIKRGADGWDVELKRDQKGDVEKSEAQLISDTCGKLLAFHQTNAKAAWEHTQGSKRPTWAGAMICDDNPQHSAYITELKTRAEKYLPSEKYDSVEETRTCVWWYTDGMRKQDIRKTLTDGLSEHLSDVYTAEAKTKVQVKHAAERNFGLKGNESYGAIKSGANDMVMVTFGASAKSENFTGGKPAATLKIWEEKGVVMDSDFSSDDRIVVAGFIDGELAMWRQSGILDDDQKLVIKSVSPSSADVGESFEITIEGNALQSVKKVMIGGTVVEHESSDDGTIITADVPGTLKESVHNVEVEASGLNTATLINGLRIGMEQVEEGKTSDAKKASGCSSRPSATPWGGAALLSLLGLLLGVRRRA